MRYAKQRDTFSLYLNNGEAWAHFDLARQDGDVFVYAYTDNAGHTETRVTVPAARELYRKLVAEGYKAK